MWWEMFPIASLMIASGMSRIGGSVTKEKAVRQGNARRIG